MKSILMALLTLILSPSALAEKNLSVESGEYSCYFPEFNIEIATTIQDAKIFLELPMEGAPYRQMISGKVFKKRRGKDSQMGRVLHPKTSRVWYIDLEALNTWNLKTFVLNAPTLAGKKKFLKSSNGRCTQNIETTPESPALQ